jgi:hypothetical protein
MVRTRVCRVQAMACWFQLPVAGVRRGALAPTAADDQRAWHERGCKEVPTQQVWRSTGSASTAPSTTTTVFLLQLQQWCDERTCRSCLALGRAPEAWRAYTFLEGCWITVASLRIAPNESLKRRQRRWLFGNGLQGVYFAISWWHVFKRMRLLRSFPPPRQRIEPGTFILGSSRRHFPFSDTSQRLSATRFFPQLKPARSVVRRTGRARDRVDCIAQADEQH